MALNFGNLRWRLKYLPFRNKLKLNITQNFENKCFIHYFKPQRQNYFVQSSNHNFITISLWKRSTFGNYSIIQKPSDVSESSPVPNHITKPPYADSGEPNPAPSSPEIKTEYEILGVKKASEIAQSILSEISSFIKIGVTGEDIDVIVRNKTFESGSYPSPFNYRGFPKSCCTSVNNVACHGIPDNRPLEDGDIISVDVTVYHKGFHGDCCQTFLVGNVDEPGKHLVDVTRKCRDCAIALCGPGVPFSDIGTVIEDIARQEDLTVVPVFVGHGIGTYFHGPPDIYHCYNDIPGVMEPGMTFTIEPILAQGREDVVILEDGWTAVMLDNGRAAQFEHTILITEGGHEILTDPI